MNNECVEDDWRKRKPGRPRIPGNIVEEWKELREGGWTYNAIALYYERGYATVWRYLNDGHNY